ncbi:hypothetical protein [Limnobacter litoralis]|uniref:Glycosyl transferase n=1 Tax=Limnobacter litoralis TaxID=481366 RepID=A0ABQ5YSB5_9BURK|nr:hypothetical protein [Limnobacter litoralis]GLR26171.1 glycosyl transferase [Limnobacter litoralis]
MSQTDTIDSTAVQDALRALYAHVDEQVQQVEYAIACRPANVEDHIKSLGHLVGLCEKRPYDQLFELNTGAAGELCTRFAAIYHRILGDCSSKLSFKSVVMLTLQKRFISQVFEISGFRSERTLQTILRRRGKDFPDKALTQNQAALRNVLISSVGTLSAEELVQLSLDESETAALLAIGLLLDRMPTTLAGEAGRQFLLEQYNPYGALQPLDVYKALVANVWMLCSYSVCAGKHEIKKHLNAWYKRVHKAKGLRVHPTGSVRQPGNVDNKPVMAVMAESFSSAHAMYRWYAPIIKRLKADYFLCLVALRADVDEDSIALFDRFLEVSEEDELNVQNVMDACTPDIAYFMSVGMRSWSISMANLRWAPLQVMSFGHPATTHSTEMDLAFINTRTVGEPGIVAENMLVLDSEIGSLIEIHKDLRLPAPPELSNTEVRIAIPCNLMKINIGFMAALKEIERQAEKPVHFTFFPNQSGISHLTTALQIQRFFPNATVARRTSYDKYLALLNQHHLALSPFPFGNATSTIDCMVLGLPSIGLLGQEPHARSDFDVLAAFDLQEFCVADSVENYVHGVVRYINTPGLLDELRALVASKNFMERHQVSENPLSEEFCNALKWAHANVNLVKGPRGVVFESAGRWV